jgi:phage terminase large subunit-like protein
MMTTSRSSGTGKITPEVAERELKTHEYARSVVAGDIVTSKKVRQACERHLRDLQRVGKDPTFPYRFDPVKAYRPIAFTERHCRPSKGNFERIQLEPWDHFVFGSVFGWVHVKTGVRRFRHALIFMARKQGKSLKASALSLFCASQDGERGAMVYHLANCMKQVREATFDECKKMVRKSPHLRKHFKPQRDCVYFDKTESEIKPQAADSERLDSLNTHVAVFDEIHEYKNYTLINVIDNSTGSRTQPLLIYITTAGYVLDGPLMDMYDRAADVLDPDIDIHDDRTFYFMAELDEDDDIEDVSCWVKANPNLGVSVQLEDMVEKWEKDKLVPAQRNDFITKRLNIFVQADEQSFVGIEVLKRNEAVLDLSTLRGRPCIGGFDLSNTEDFTSACLEFPLAREDVGTIRIGRRTEKRPLEGGVFVLSHSFIPEAKVRRDNEQIPYREWEKAGYLTICPGDYVDYSRVYEWFVAQAELYTLLKIAYDPKNALHLNKALMLYGGAEWVTAVRQGPATLNAPLKNIKELLLAGKAVSNCDPLLRWYTNNVKLVVADRNGNWLPTKQGRYRKIDGFAAWLNAHTETMQLPPPTPPGAPAVTFFSRKDL